MNYGSITLSAENLGISQPAVSQSIAQLERKLGCNLFERRSQKIVPTTKAFQLLETLVPMFDTLEALEPPDRAQSDGELIRIISTPVFSRSFLVPLLLDFKENHNNIKFRLETVSMNAIPGLLQERYADLALVNHFRFPGESPIIDEPLARSKMCIYLPKTHRLSDHTVITPEDLSGEPLIVPSKRYLWSRKLRKAFEDSQAELNDIIEFGSAGLITDFLRLGVGLAIATAFPMCNVLPDGFTSIPFKPEIYRYSSFYYLSGTEPSPAIKNLKDLARSNINSMPHTELVDTIEGSVAENLIRQ